MDNVNVFLMSIKDKIPKDAILALQASLEKMGEQGLQRLMLLNLKSPIIAIVLSLLFGILGVDRFYKGDIKLGVAKIALWILSLVILFSAILSVSEALSPFMSDDELVEIILNNSFFSFSLGLIGILACYAWWIVDIFLVFFGIKKDNLGKIHQALQ